MPQRRRTPLICFPAELPFMDFPWSISKVTILKAFICNLQFSWALTTVIVLLVSQYLRLFSNRESSMQLWKCAEVLWRILSNTWGIAIDFISYTVSTSVQRENTQESTWNVNTSLLSRHLFCNVDQAPSSRLQCIWTCMVPVLSSSCDKIQAAAHRFYADLWF